MQICLNPYEYTLLCWVYFMLGCIKLECSIMKCPHPRTAYKWQQICAGLWNMQGSLPVD